MKADKGIAGYGDLGHENPDVSPDDPESIREHKHTQWHEMIIHNKRLVEILQSSAKDILEQWSGQEFSEEQLSLLKDAAMVLNDKVSSSMLSSTIKTCVDIIKNHQGGGE